AECEAIRLFLDRARGARPDFALSEHNTAAIVETCRQLDGLPLAIELAAARVRVLSPQQIAARLQDRFHLLGRPSGSGSPHQQTLRATMDWSYELLSERERAVLRQLSVFAGGSTLE